MSNEPDAEPCDSSIPTLLTVAETAVLLRVNRCTIYRMIEAGHVPVLRFGTTLRIPSRQLLAGLEQ